MLLAELSRPYVDLETLRRMSEVAHRLAVCRKAVTEIRDIEDQLMAAGTTVGGLRDAMRDTAALARVASKAAAEAMGMLKGLKLDVEGYLAEVKVEMEAERDAAS
jgi:hypothetical protein